MRLTDLIWYLIKLRFGYGNMRVGAADIDENGYEFISLNSGLAVVRMVNEKNEEEKVVTLLNLDNFDFPDDEENDPQKKHLKVVQ